eukprot:1014255-Rhodomonas_salina.5
MQPLEGADADPRGSQVLSPTAEEHVAISPRPRSDEALSPRGQEPRREETIVVSTPPVELRDESDELDRWGADQLGLA